MYVDTKKAEVLRRFSVWWRIRNYLRSQVVMGAKYRLYRSTAVTSSSPATDYYYLGHHKCATHWMRTFLYHLAPVVQANYKIYGGAPHRQFEASWLHRTIHLHVNSDVEVFRSIPDEARGFHIIRDPRDALVSDYFSRRYAHAIHNEWHVRMREYLNTHSMEEGLVYLLDQSPYFQQVEGWKVGSRPNILDVRYEDLVSDEFAGFRRIVDHLGFRVPDETLQRIVRSSSFRTMSKGRKRGQENSSSQFRKGVAGDWRNHMPEGSRAFEEFNARWADLVVDLGYDL